MGRTATIPGLIAIFASSFRLHPRLIIASKNFTEQVVLGEIIAQHLERRHVNVARRFNLGGTMLAHQALVSGDIDLYPEYTGTALTAIFKQQPQTDPAIVLDQV